MTRVAKMGKKTHEEATGWAAMKKSVDGARKSNEGATQQGGVNKDAQRRQDRRQKFRQVDTICFGCRQRGHAVSNCPNSDAGGICYRCGQSNHTTASCRVRPKPGEPEYPFATCFICKERGHLSKACPDNPRGLYPNGGCCNVCGSVEHLRRDCPDLLKSRGQSKFKLSMNSAAASADAEDVAIGEEEEAEEAPPSPPKEKKKKKLVKF
eukprot:m.28120 g.28120  ORF g.28120 m.28120 type:complete len:209 (-) comp4500_c0_seq2:87-713(-)